MRPVENDFRVPRGVSRSLNSGSVAALSDPSRNDRRRQWKQGAQGWIGGGSLAVKELNDELTQEREKRAELENFGRLQKAPVIKLLSEQSLKEQNDARTALRVVFSSIRYLARSGQALRGHSYEDGNLRLLLDERSQDVPALGMWMKRRDKWLSADVQNEVIEIMSHELLRGIIQEVKHSTFFSIIADGTTDVPSSEQFSL
ncbi:hypothetical protein HPB47_025178 [Ixodes persulcatus]|uniref:Uncharacterized protein n=1 Tax=Ixodes persulcatus TaxID=34615 RepID=A0AC60Q493_IXOPE|nr:hypothetical protein HPB47_025178 [Ixodes persulcatus]